MKTNGVPSARSAAAAILGRQGGAAKTKAQDDARRKNIKRAQAKRWPKKKRLDTERSV